jgi:hypothetical protein
MLIASIVMLGIGPLSAYAQEVDDKRAAAEAECSKLATEKSGYDPSSQSSTASTVGKGAAVGAGGGAVIGAATGGSKKLLKGAAIGAAVGAGAGAIKDSQDKKASSTAQGNYQLEYDKCMSDKGY